MRVTLKTFGLLQRVIGAPVTQLDIRAGSTIRDVVAVIVEKWGEDARRLMMDSDCISGNLIVMINMTDVDLLDGQDTSVNENDEIAILPHVQGG